MEVVLLTPSGHMSTVMLPYAIGDIVKIKSPNYCVINTSIENLFGIKNALVYPKHDEMMGLHDFPNLDKDTNDWKILDMQSVYTSSIVILLRNRVGEYVAMSQPVLKNLLDECYCVSIFDLVRKSKKAVERIVIKSKH